MRVIAFAALAVTSIFTQANAGTVTASIYLNSAAAGNATIANRPAGPADATFTFNGTANFDNRLIPGPGAGISQLDTIDQFLATGGIAPVGGTVGGSILNNSYWFFSGSIGLHAGANTFTITHDDGFEFNIDGIGIVASTPFATAPVPTTFTVTAPTTGNYTYEFSYGETSSGPAVITVFGGTLQPVPESPSLAILGGGLGLLGLGLRRRVK